MSCRWRPALAVGVGLCCWFGFGSARADELQGSVPEDHVYGGGPVAPCDWPTTVSLGGCTGTLVHPQVVIYAAHCGSVSDVYFGDSVYGQGRTVYPEFCQTYPGGGPGGGTDWAFCKLSEPVTDIPITPPLMGCETELLQPGADVWLVGFGNTDDGNFGVKYEALAEFNYIQNDEAFIGGGGVDTCQGDSGGPVYIQLDDGTWRAFGITSYGDGCGGGGWYSMMHTGMDWFESASGVDLTPCHDADGTWNPSEACKGFAVDANAGAGSWPDACDFGELSGWSATCGAPYMVEDDDLAPHVQILTPGDGERVEGGGNTTTVRVEVDADDGDGSGIREVALLIDGVALSGVATSPPFAFEIALTRGAYELTAVAVDFADNSAESSSVHIGVDMEADDPDAPGGGGSGPGAGDGGSGDGGPDDDLDALPSDYGLAREGGCACRTDAAPNPWPFGGIALLGFVAVVRRRTICP